MGVEFRYYLIAKPNSFLPEARQLLLFLRKAEAGQWLQPQYAGWIAKRANGKRSRREALKLGEAAEAIAKQGESGIRMGWRLWRCDDEDIPYDLEIHLSFENYVYHVSESIASFGESVNCVKCSTRLDHELEMYLLEVRAIYAKCPRCGTPFDPSNIPATYTQGWTGEKSVLLGGATYRLALIIDNVPREEWAFFNLIPLS